MTYPDTVNGKCCKCGSESLTLAKDSTAYSPCEFDEETQKWASTYSHTEESTAYDAIRLFCADCGEYHNVPEELV